VETNRVLDQHRVHAGRGKYRWHEWTAKGLTRLLRRADVPALFDTRARDEQHETMAIRHLVLTCLSLLVGCQSDAGFPRSDADAQLFGPVAMRLHPIFTQVKDWTGDDRPDGIEALVELQDQFGDPTKASGRVLFELYEFRSHEPERRGQRVVNPWMGYLETLDEQRDRWNRTSRTYGFQLDYDQIQPSQSYVLTAEFQLSGGGRFFDQMILDGRRRSPLPSATSPSTLLPPLSTEDGAPPPTTSPQGNDDAGPARRNPEP
jgi:hypothetical protein